MLRRVKNVKDAGKAAGYVGMEGNDGVKEFFLAFEGR